MSTGYTLDEARDALFACDPGCDRDQWVKLGMSAKAAGLSLELFDAWSANGSQYSERDTRDTWRSMNAEGGVGPGTLFHIAKEGGWRPGQTLAPMRRREVSTAASKVRQNSGDSGRAAEVWASCTPATDSHPYIAAKSGRAEGLRVVPAEHPLRIAGQSVAGWLVVPVTPLSGGDPVSLQFIPPPGEGMKLNLPGASMAGVFVVGDLAAGGIVQVCEGIGQAWACWKATGNPSLVCFGWGRVKSIAAELRAVDSEAQIVIVPDKGKEVEAEAIARQVSGVFVTMPEGAPPNYDANDYAAEHGGDELEVLMTAPKTPSHRFRLLRSEDIRGMPPMAWRIRGVFPAQGLTSIYGASGSGKSFLALDMAAAISEGQPWFGHRVEAAPVVYVALEGTAGFRQRVLAWEHHNGRTLPDRMHLVIDPFKLTQNCDVDDFASLIRDVAGEGAVIIIDTLNRAAPDADENSSAAMGQILEAAKELQQRIVGLVVLIHHTGKDESSGLRGHSSLVAALDAALVVKRKNGARSWSVFKAKDGRDGADHPFHLLEVTCPAGPDGEAITSCVVQSADMGALAQHVKNVKLPQGANQRIVMETLRPLFEASNVFGMNSAAGPRSRIALEEAVLAASKAMTCPSDRRATRARDAINSLVGKGILVCQDGVLWMA